MLYKTSGDERHHYCLSLDSSVYALANNPVEKHIIAQPFHSVQCRYSFSLVCLSGHSNVHRALSPRARSPRAHNSTTIITMCSRLGQAQ